MVENELHLFNGRSIIIYDESDPSSLLFEKDAALAEIRFEDDVDIDNCKINAKLNDNNNNHNSEYFRHLSKAAYKYNSNIIIYSAVSEGNDIMKYVFNSQSSNSISTNV